MSDPAQEQEAAPAPAAAPAPSRLVRWAPTLAGLALAGVGFGALGVAQSQVEITVRPPEAPAEGPDPLALLRDDVATLQADLSALSKGLGANLEQLARGLDGASAERDDEQAQQLAQLQQRLRTLERAGNTRAQRLAQQLAALRAELAQRGAAPVASEETPLAQAPAPEPIPEPAPEPEPAEPAPAEPGEPEPAPKKKRGLFSFKLAGGGPDFSQRQRYQVIASLSRVGFDAKSTLHDFSGVTSKVRGWLTTRLTGDDAHARGHVEAEVAELKTGVDGRDEEMLKRLDAKTHPKIVFELSRLEAKQSDTKARTYSGLAHGAFRIHGKRKEVTVPVEIEVDRSRRLVAKGEVGLQLTDFGIEPPSVAGAINMENEIKVWLSLRLRSLGQAEADQ